MTKQLYDYQNDENLDLFVLIKAADVRVAKNGKKFIAFVFQDRSGEISGKFWDAGQQDIAQYQTGKVVHLTGKRELYQGKPQIKIFKLHIAKAGEPQQPEQFLPKAPVDQTTLQDEINQAIFTITPGPVTFPFEVYGLTRHDGQCQRIMGLLFAVSSHNLQFRFLRRFTELLINRIILEHQQAVDQRIAPTPRPALHVR